MSLNRDGKEHLYAEVENIRITYIPATDRTPQADWAGSDVIRVQAYKGSNDKSLHMGAELPVSSPEVFGNLIAALCQVYIEGRS
jgi:hypothetical protein